MAKELKNLTKRADNYSQWYNDLVVKADLAELSPVRGCMIIKPYGYATWEKQAQREACNCKISHFHFKISYIYVI